MTLPTFLGIGVPRGGTTWLHSLLEGHPDVYMPGRRKEIRFFDRHYHRGMGWYEGFFASSHERKAYRAVGEISPQYLYCEECPARIASSLPGAKLILLLRHPVDRAYSQYGFSVQRRNYRGSFQDFIAVRPRALEYGCYSKYIEKYLRYFPRDHLLVMISEHAFADVATSCRRLAEFIDVPMQGFRMTGVGDKVNQSSVPRARSLAGGVVTMGRRLRRWRLEPIVDLGRRIGVQRMFRGNPLPPLDVALRRELSKRYEDEFDQLERLLELDVGRWKGQGCDAQRS